MYNDAQMMLKNIINNKLLSCRGIIAFYKANSVGDDIEVYDENGKTLETFHGIRQQVRDSEKFSNSCITYINYPIFVQ